MAPTASMFIRDWKKEELKINEPVPSFIDCFSTDHFKKDIINGDLNSLKYFDYEVDLDVIKLERKFNESCLPLLCFGTREKYEPDLYGLPLYKCNNMFIRTNQKLLSTVMCTPFPVNNKKLKWKINAVWRTYSNYSYIELNTNDYVLNELSDFCVCDRLKRHLFFKMPIEQYRNYISIADRRFYEIFNINIGNHPVYYTAEICGLGSTSQVKTKSELPAENFFIDAFDVSRMQFNRYNPVWWSQCKLINAKHCIIGTYKYAQGCSEYPFNQILKFPTDIFADTYKYENLWSPAASFNFLNDFLTFVVKEVNAVRSDLRGKCIWEFESYADKPCVTCEAYIEEKNGNCTTRKTVGVAII